jgi:glycine betaine/proline transport system permease protein
MVMKAVLMRNVMPIVASILVALGIVTILDWVTSRLLPQSTFLDLFSGRAKIPVGRWSKTAFDWLNDNVSAVFDAISAALEWLIEGVLAILTVPPDIGWLTGAEGYVPLYREPLHAFVVVGAFVGLTWVVQRSWKTCLGVALGFLYVLNQGYWEETAESLTLILSSCVVCMAAGVPIGIAAAHRPRLYAVLQPVLDLMQTLPTFVYLIPAIVFFGLGMVPGLIATVIFVLPAPIRLTHLGISTTPQALLEAATAFGATKRQVLWKVELPWALPQIMTGLNQVIMLSLSMVVIAALVGANGLGVPVVRALNSVNTALGFESGFVIVVVAIILDRMLRVVRA